MGIHFVVPPMEVEKGNLGSSVKGKEEMGTEVEAMNLEEMET